MNLLIGLPALLALIEIRAYIDYYLIEHRNRYVNHPVRGAIQSLVMVAIVLITNCPDYHNIIQLFAQTLTYFAVFWLFFDIRLNQKRGLHWLYVPVNPNRHTAKTDKLLRKFNLTGLSQLNLKIGLIILFVGIYYNN